MNDVHGQAPNLSKGIEKVTEYRPKYPIERRHCNGHWQCPNSFDLPEERVGARHFNSF